MKINYVSTASFCVDNARELGIPAALLLDKIVRLSKHTTRHDEFCWYTAKQFEEDTSLKEDAFLRAAHLLEEKGIVERKVTYIVGTMTKATHFRLTPVDENLKPGQSRFPQTRSDQVSVNTINNTINMRSANASAGASAFANATQPEANASPRPSASPRLSSRKEKKDGGVLSNLPFDEEVKVLGPPRGGRSAENITAGKILREFGEIIGLSTGGNRNKEVHRIKQLLDEGKTEEDILWVAEWTKDNDFYKDSSLMTRLSADAVDQAELAKKGKVDSTKIDKVTEEYNEKW